MEPDRRDDLVSLSAIVTGAVVTVVVTVMSLVMTDDDFAQVAPTVEPAHAPADVREPSSDRGAPSDQGAPSDLYGAL